MIAQPSLFEDAGSSSIADAELISDDCEKMIITEVFRSRTDIFVHPQAIARHLICRGSEPSRVSATIRRLRMFDILVGGNKGLAWSGSTTLNSAAGPQSTRLSGEIVGGTRCERRIAEILREREGRSMLREELERQLYQEGHARSTIIRATANLRQNGNVRVVRTFRLESLDLPYCRTNYSRPGHEPQRWTSDDRSSEIHAEYVRNYLADRIDDIFLQPNAYLRKVLTAVELAGKIADAADRGDARKLRDALDEYRSFWIDTEGNEYLHGLNANRLMEALQVGLFPESFADDPEVAERLEEVRKEVAERRAKEIAESKKLSERYNKIVAENSERVARGQQPLPVFDHGPRKRYRRHEREAIDVTEGIVPTGGGERVGESRLLAFLSSVGVTPDVVVEDQEALLSN